MKIDCLNGFFIFKEVNAGELTKFKSLFGFEISEDDTGLLTFEALINAPKHSIAGNEWLGNIATATFEGSPWLVMKENALVYDVSNEVVVPRASIIRQAQFDASFTYFVSRGLIQPGSLMTSGSRVGSYSAEYLFGSAHFRYSWIDYV